jgi:hypothetical protein
MKLLQAFFALTVITLSPALWSSVPQDKGSQPPASQSPNSPSPDAASAAQDAAAKAAERRKRFEAEKARLENSDPKPKSQAGSSAPDPCHSSENDLSLSPIFVNMTVGDTHGFSLFDIAGHKLTSQAEWSVSDSSIAELRVENGVPVLSAKQLGTVRLTARVDTRSIEATINVITPEELMKPGTVQWRAAGYPCSHSTRVVQAVPH